MQSTLWYMMLLGLGFAANAAADERSERDFFETRIRPVLVAQCYECHSGTAPKLQGGLRLDSRDAIRAGGHSGPAVVPGKTGDSLLLSALRHEAFEMPPGKKLSPSVVADFERWIQRGAVDPRDQPGQHSAADEIRLAASHHWAFQPIADPAPPNATGAGETALSPIDRFLLERLEAAGLSLSPPADRARWLRRAHLDLLGLPPSPEAVAEFLADQRPDALERCLDRLLASPVYGERWGRHWLDVARYADNKGYVFFEEQRFPWAWTYRDYVIRAFNDDLPLDRFVLEQLAADQLRLGDDQRPLAALGFLTLGPRFMNNAHDILDDRIDVVTRGLLGLTVTCARCHDHKYDPVSQADYYALYGVMRSSVEPLPPPEFLPAPDTDAYREFQAGMRERVEKLRQFISSQREQLVAGVRGRVAEYLLAVHEKRLHPETEEFMLITDKGALNPAMIHRWEVYLNRARRDGDPIWTAWHAFAEIDDGKWSEQAGQVAARLLANADADVQPIHPLVRQAFRDSPPASMNDVTRIYAQLLAGVQREWEQAVERAAASGTAATRLEDDDRESLRQVLYGPHSPASLPRELSWGFLDLLPDRPSQGEFKQLLQEVEKWSSQQPGAPPRAMVLADAETPYEPVIFLRGNPNREGPPVARGYPAFFAASGPARFQHGSGRLELAQRIIAPDNPLTARVLVNRVWMHHFGRGLVETTSDFGLRSEPPSHPELLDWLASYFRRSGWSIKQLHRVIMTSAAYRQSAAEEGAAWERARGVDPENRLLWAFPRRRLDFEAMRDSLLAVAGQLQSMQGGPPESLLDGFVPRRTVYGFVDRMDPPGLARAFDFPDPAASSPQRERTTVPAQALFFLNHPFVSQCAQHLLSRSDVAGLTTDEQRLQRIYQILYARPPDDHELALARQYLSGSGTPGADGASAAAATSDPAATTPDRWLDYVQGLLMTNEFLFVD
ncbi:MAG: PSD1 domain-containing protein [Pirellulaceae bacterium]|nr:PSD1 domain-containing protein [Pirellulaceae bacterium]